MNDASPFRDTPRRYGLVSRALHWAVAYLLLWQFLTLAGWKLIGDGEVMRTVSEFGPYHGTVGVLVLAAFVPRVIWLVVNRRRRPKQARTPLGILATAGHHTLYLLMFLVPALALLRAYGNGKGYTLWGFQLVPTTGERIEWLVATVNWLHSPLAWVLAAMIGGHILMALFHHTVRRDDTLRRMAGPIRAVSPQA
ncbi:cytochrome b [Aureimonas sp. ME7]|uniref:cytochrome b n=1 Tax=Aureimonas sp. ME7 TaxID=2744252 RepID=UPI0015F6BE3E|nr:cytochrome b [Aureimonas sp. ME7]